MYPFYDPKRIMPDVGGHTDIFFLFLLNQDGGVLDWAGLGTVPRKQDSRILFLLRENKQWIFNRFEANFFRFDSCFDFEMISKSFAILFTQFFWSYFPLLRKIRSRRNLITIDTSSAGGIDDSAKLLFPEDWPCGFGACICALQMNLHDLVPFLVWHVLETRRMWVRRKPKTRIAHTPCRVGFQRCW